MLRFLLLMALAGLAWQGLEKLAGQLLGSHEGQPRQPEPRRSAAPPQPVELRACTACGAYFPAPDGLGEARQYCSRQCLERSRS